MFNNQGAIDELIKTITKLPGVGPRSAKKIVFHMLHNQMIPNIIENLSKVSKTVTTCKKCRNFADTEVCGICSGNRDTNILCLVRDNIDLSLVESTKTYKGHYFILGKNFAPSSKNSSSIVEEIRERIAENKVSEVILAFNLSLESRTIMYYICDSLADLELKITNLGMGISIGTDFEYIDTQTMAAAIENRQKIH